MGKSKNLSPAVKQIVVDSYRQTGNYSETARVLKMDRKTVYAVVKRCEIRGSAGNAKKSGRPRKMDVRDERQLLRLVKFNRTTPLKDITGQFNQGRQVPVSERSIHRYLSKNKYHRRVCRKKIRIREQNRKNRVAWARGKRRWTVDYNWSKVIFSDECKVVLGQNNRVYIWRKAGEEWLPACISPGAPPKPAMSLMLWGCITWNGVGTLTVVNGNINANKYIDILEEQLWPVVVKIFPTNDYIFQDDNAPVHRARIVQEYKQINRIPGMFWPAQSPDANIIENIWFLLKNKLKRRLSNINNVTDLERNINDIWINIPVTYIRNLYRSLPSRMLKMIRSKGYITKY